MDAIIRTASLVDDGDGDLSLMVPSRPAPSPPSANIRTFRHETLSLTPSQSRLPPPPSQLPPSQLPPLPPSVQRPVTAHADLPAPLTVSSTPTPSRSRKSSISEFVSRAAGHSIPITEAKSKNGRSKSMLRKHKVRDQEEALKQQRLAVSEREPPPQIPPTSFMPVIDDFGGPDTTRPNSSIAPLRTSNGQPAGRSQVNNFSRPGFMTASSSNISLEPLSSLPSSQLHWSPSGASTNGGKSYAPSTTTESMANRGRESYSSPALGVNSPRRMRKRKDATPFK